MSNQTQNFINNFITLPHADKVSKVTTMLEALKDVWGVIWELRNMIQITPDPEDQLLNMVYKTIMETADEIEKKIHDTKMKEFYQIKQNIQNIQDKEKAEQEDTDAMLQQL